MLELLEIDPADDQALANFLDETEKQLAARVPQTPAAPPQMGMNITNTVNNVKPNMPIPMMYFPGSTVTINYNFQHQ